MPKLTPAEEIKQLKHKLKIAEELAEERGKIIYELNLRFSSSINQAVIYRDKVKTLENHLHKVCIAYDTVRQVMSRSSAALNLDDINPLTSIQQINTIYNNNKPQTPNQEQQS